MLIPIGDKAKDYRFTILNWMLISVNVLIYFYETRLPTFQLEVFFFQWGVVPQFLLQAVIHPFSLQSLQVFSTLITSQFVHVSLWHILGNMLFLYTFGPNVEQRLDLLGYLIFYLLCGVVAGITEAVVLLIVVGPVATPIIGASGAIAGVLGAYLVFSPLHSVYLRLFPLPFALPVPAFILILFWFGQQLLDGLAALSPIVASQSEVAFWAHIGGFVCGMLAALFLVIPANQRQAVVRTLLPIEQGPVAWMESAVIAVLALLLVGIVGSYLVNRLTGGQSGTSNSAPTVALATAVPTEGSGGTPSPTAAAAPTVRAREVAALSGHTGYISSLVFSPDGKLLASASSDRTIRLWDATTFKLVTILSGHSGAINSLAFSPDGSTLASASIDKTIKLWNVRTGRLIATFRGHTDAATSVSFSHGGMNLASASSDRTVRIWNIPTVRSTMILPAQPDGVMAVAYSPDGSLLATAGKDTTVRLYASSGAQLAVLVGNTGIVYGLAWSHDNNRLASAGGDHIIRVWDVKTGQLVSTLQGHSDIVFNVAFSPDDSRLVSTSRDKNVIVWDLASAAPLTSFTPSSAAVIGLGINPLGTLIAIGGLDMIVHVWNTR